MKQLSTVDPDIERILKLEELFVTDPQLWVRYLMHERAQFDYEDTLNSRLEKGFAQGLEKGMEKGIEKGMEKGLIKGEQLKAIETACKMLQDSMAPELISKFTGLSEEEIRALREE